MRPTSARESPRRSSPRYQRRLAWLLAGLSLPGLLIALLLLWLGDYQLKTQWTLTLILLVSSACFLAAVMNRITFPLRTCANLIAAIREGDFSLRVRGRREDAFGELAAEINHLTNELHDRRLASIEADAVFRALVREIDAAVFAFDEQGRLRLANPSAQRLLNRPAEQLLDRPAAELGFSELLNGQTPRVEPLVFPGAAGGASWEIRRGSFRQHGLPHQFVVLSDVTRPLRQQERAAWSRLLQVLRHEVNNSLAPIHSLADSSLTLLGQTPRPSDCDTDLREALGVISGRSLALSRFMSTYTRLTSLPPPRKSNVDVADWIHRTVALEKRLSVKIIDSPPIMLQADSDQLDQLLINLIANAVEAAMHTNGGVRVAWTINGDRLELSIEDDGPGISNTDNLFVPFYTTKPQGSGIGLVLSRQIAEAHGGTLTLENRQGASGCVARLTLPMDSPVHFERHL